MEAPSRCSYPRRQPKKPSRPATKAWARAGWVSANLALPGGVDATCLAREAVPVPLALARPPQRVLGEVAARAGARTGPCCFHCWDAEETIPPEFICECCVCTETVSPRLKASSSGMGQGIQACACDGASLTFVTTTTSPANSPNSRNLHLAALSPPSPRRECCWRVPPAVLLRPMMRFSRLCVSVCTCVFFVWVGES